jgi:sulfite reductase (NADPH) flavoprotein alpha-component
MSIPVLPESAPFSAEQRAWINGYLAGLFGNGDAPSQPSTPNSQLTNGPLLFLYGSQTGSSEGLAKRFAKESRIRGFDARAVGMEDHTSLDLAKESRVCIVTSTYGEGDMPDNAQGFWDHVRNGTAPALNHLEFSVLALGDTNYVQFCEAGRQFDKRFEELGAKRIHPRTDCDVDYEEPAQGWFEGVMEYLTQRHNGAKEDNDRSARVGPLPPPTALREPNSYSKTNPFPAVLKANRVLNAPGSAKETRHFEILLESSGLEYEVGDALGVVPANCPDFVQEILAAAGLDGEEEVNLPDGTKSSLRLALLHKFDLKPFLETLPENGVRAADLVSTLRKLQPRLYSISSSPKAHPGEVHLTVAIVRYEHNGRPRKGVCSTFLADRVTGESNVPVFVHKSPHFKLPADGSTPVIMVGPGTGIAPFRAFIEERRATGATGRNWLFFGDQRAAADFLYRDELEAMRNDGFLTRLDTAFSRDQPEKVYVQHRMSENAPELWSWLQDGASFYVCGDAKRMAKDVDAALHQVAGQAGGLGPDAAADFVKQLKAEKRYLRDVY